jgi:hypothetical protein
MQICGLYFTKPIIDWINYTVRTEPLISRRELSRRLCEENNWRSPNGNLKDMSCRKALVELQRRNAISLPVIINKYNFEKNIDPVPIETAQISCSLAELGQLIVRPVNSRHSEESKIWRSLLDTYHYLGSGPLCGAQIRYLIESTVYGPIGAMAFTSASFALKARDQYIGWTEAAKRKNLSQVVCNTRMLIVPTVQVPNLASHALSLTLTRLADNWEERYAIRPVLVETFVDPRWFSGTCYKAANWNYVGDTAGRRDGIAKKIFLRPLCIDWRERLCKAPPILLGEIPRPEEPTNWAEEELGTVCFYDERLKQRLYVLAQDFYNNSGANIPEACGGSKARTVAAYRFFRNKAVSMDVILTPHIESTIERIKEHSVVLAPQDTTVLDYNTHLLTEGLGPLNGKHGGLGLILHDTLAFTENGTPLGVLDAQCWARDLNDLGKSKKRKDLPIEQKESIKWLRSFRKLTEIQQLCPDTMIVSIGDRESDIYELLLEATEKTNVPKLLIRAAGRDRNRKVEDKQLWDFMATQDVKAKLQIHIPRSGSRVARDAWVDLRYAKVDLSPPERCTSYPSITAWAVYLLEEPQTEEAKNPIEWLLLTTAPVESVDDAKQRVEWYSGRWGIEVYHRTLKSGCRISDRQLREADRLEACIGIDMVVAWRIYYLTMLGRETPNVTCTEYFEDIEWKTLCCLITKNPVPPNEPPTIAEAIRMVGRLGGYLDRKGDDPPGTQVLWRGLQRLEMAVEAARLFKIFNKP